LAIERSDQCVAPGGVAQGSADRIGDLVVADLACRAGPWLVKQPVKPVRGKAATPLAGRIGVRAQFDADHLVLQPSRSRQYNARPPRHRLARLLRPGQRLQLPELRRTQLNRNRRLAHHDHPPKTRMIV
jgi:hypothetical protein